MTMQRGIPSLRTTISRFAEIDCKIMDTSTKRLKVSESHPFTFVDWPSEYVFTMGGQPEKEIGKQEY